MKRRWMIGPPVLVIAICLAVAVLAIARRHRLESRLAELTKTDQSIQAAILSARTRATPSGHSNDNPPNGSPGVLKSGKSETTLTAHPDVNEIFAAHPELQAAYKQATAGRLHQTYDRLWARLGLSSAQIEQAVSVLMRDDENEMDLSMTAAALKLSEDDPALRQYRREEMATTQSSLELVLGPQGYQALRDYNRTLAMRSTAEEVAAITAVSDAPLTGLQTEQLTQVLAEATTSYRHGGQPDRASTDWDDVLRKAAMFLTPPQLAAVQAKAQQAKTAAMLTQFYASRAPH